MGLRLEIKRKLSSRSDRVKSVDFHGIEPWLLVSLYNGSCCIWNYETQSLVKTFEITEVPVRIARFITRKQWFIAGSDDMTLRVYNYNTHERTAQFEAHGDYVRCLAVHPTRTCVLSCSDDMTIKMWDWEKNWKCVMTYEGHTHYVMMIAINPKDTNTFASASLDRTIKVWSMGSSTANYTLEGHEKGVNCVDYYHGGDKPYLVSGADDRLVKVWDFQNKSCVQTMDGHSNNITAVAFHPTLPIIISGSEDGTVRLWHSSTYRLENTLNYGMERVWAIAYFKGSNDVAVAYDEGCISIKLGREEPTASMDNSGKIIWTRHNEVQTANIKTSLDEQIKDGEKMTLPIKELGTTELYPQSLLHSPNGRFVVVCGDGEYIIYTALAWRNKAFGSALDFVWALDSNVYAIRESTNRIRTFSNFKEKSVLGVKYSSEALYGGALIGVRGNGFLCFYDWETTSLVRRIDVVPQAVYWSEQGELVAITTEESCYILRFDRNAYQLAMSQEPNVPEDGYESAFELLGEINEIVNTGTWSSDCFIYTNTLNRLNYYVGGEVTTVAHFDNSLYLLGYLPANNRIYLADKNVNVVSYALSLAVIEYQTAVLRGDLAGAASSLLPSLSSTDRNRVARFLEGQGHLETALQVSTDADHRFELAMQLKLLDVAYELAHENPNETKWQQVADFALSEWRFDLSEEALIQAKDVNGLFLLYKASGNAEGMRRVAQLADEKELYNISFLCQFLLHDLDGCIDTLTKTNRLPEAALFAHTYKPSRLNATVSRWRDSLAKTNKKASEVLVLPSERLELFPDHELALEVEQQVSKLGPVSALAHDQVQSLLQTDLLTLRQLGQLESALSSLPRADEVPLTRSAPSSHSPTRPSQASTFATAHATGRSPLVSAAGAGTRTKEPSVYDDVQSHQSLEVNTTGTGSVRGEDLDDYGSNWSQQQQHSSHASVGRSSVHTASPATRAASSTHAPTIPDDLDAELENVDANLDDLALEDDEELNAFLNA